MSVLRFAFIFMISLFIAQSVMADEQEVYNGVVAHPKDDPGQYLKEILAHTYQFNPTIQAERNRLKSVDEEYAIAISGFRPTIIADGSHAINNTESKGPTITTGRKTLNQQTIGATISQPIFNGWKTISSVKSANKNIMAARESLRLVEQNVLLEAISAYYDVVKDQKILAVNENNVKVLEEQQKATQARFKVGQLTKTDVSQAESRLARGLSEKIRAEGRLKISRANFQRIIGFDQPRTLEF